MTSLYHSAEDVSVEGSASRPTEFNLLVTSTPKGCTSSQLELLFGAFCKVDNVQIHEDKAYVNTHDPVGAKVAMASLDSFELDGTMLNVKISSRCGGGEKTEKSKVVKEAKKAKRKAKNEDPDDPNVANLLITQLPKSVSVAELRNLFSPFVNIENVKIIGRHGYVNTRDPAGAEVAVCNLHGYDLDGSAIVVRHAFSPEKDELPDAPAATFDHASYLKDLSQVIREHSPQGILASGVKPLHNEHLKAKFGEYKKGLVSRSIVVEHGEKASLSCHFVKEGAMYYTPTDQACAPAPPSAAEKERYLVEFANALRLHAPDGIPLAAARDFHSQHLFLLFGEWDKTWHLANNPRELIDNHGLAAGITYTRRGVTESSPGHVFIQLREFFEARRRSSAPSLGAVSLESVSESLGSLDDPVLDQIFNELGYNDQPRVNNFKLCDDFPLPLPPTQIFADTESPYYSLPPPILGESPLFGAAASLGESPETPLVFKLNQVYVALHGASAPLDIPMLYKIAACEAALGSGPPNGTCASDRVDILKKALGI